MKIYFHKHEHSKGWYYLAFGKWQPFKFLQHSGWICLNWRWLKRFIYDVPKQRGWRWD